MSWLGKLDAGYPVPLQAHVADGRGILQDLLLHNSRRSPRGLPPWNGGYEDCRAPVARAPGAGKDSWGEDGEIEKEDAGQELHL